MEKTRVINYGFSGVFISIRLDELPEDIQKGIIARYGKRNGDLKITENTKNIVLACKDIFADDKKWNIKILFLNIKYFWIEMRINNYDNNWN